MVCRVCGIDKPDNKFSKHHVKSNGVVYMRRKCKVCTDVVRKQRREAIIRSINDLKTLKGCVICGINDFRVLQFHHKDKNNKEYNISDRLRGAYALVTLLKEIEKCDVICANCHLIVHYEEIHN